MKKATSITQVSATGATHSFSQEEKEAFCDHINEVLKNDPHLAKILPVSSEGNALFEACKDGKLLCKLINDAVPDTIDERVMNLGDKLNAFQMTENNNLCINSAKAIGCSVVNIGSQDIIEGREHLILGLIWQIVRIGLMSKITLTNHPELYRLLEPGEDINDLLKLPPEQILLRWLNYHLKNAGSDRRVNNFSSDIKDSVVYTIVMNRLVPDKCDKAPLNESDLTKRAEMVLKNAEKIGCRKFLKARDIVNGNPKLNLAFVANLFNTYPGLEPLTQEELAKLEEWLFASEGTREARAFALWMNSLGVEPFVNNLFNDLRDGLVLLRVMDKIEPGIVDWSKVNQQLPLNRFKMIENCNYAVELGKKLKFSLVGIGGVDIVDGNKTLTLALVWQMMRYHVLSILKSLKMGGKDVTEEDMIKWANDQVAKSGKSSRMQNFKDPSLRTGIFLLELLDSIRRCVNWDLLHFSTVVVSLISLMITNRYLLPFLFVSTRNSVVRFDQKFPQRFFSKHRDRFYKEECHLFKDERNDPLFRFIQVRLYTIHNDPEKRVLTKLLHHPSHFFELLNSKNSSALILKNNRFNKGTGFTMEEREKYGLRGLLPPVVETIEQQAKRAYAQFRSATSPIHQYIYLASLKERNETVFYYLLINHLDELCPIVYTPTVGEACLKFGHIWRAAEGMYISHHDRGQIRRILDNWPIKEVGIIVVTDGSRILGLGDLGANGMGIPIGKLSLYIAAAGFHPSVTLPILLDAGTNNKTLLEDDRYLGCREPRIPDSEYYPFLDEFLMAVKDKWPTALVQFEDFSNDHCFELLQRYRDKLLCFNDDIQGTGAVITAGFINAVKLSGIPLAQHRIVFYGAGSAAYGVANQILTLFEDAGISREKAKKNFYFVDSKGLITRDRQKLEPHKVEFARQDIDSKTTILPTLFDVVRYVKPTALIGLSGQGGAFTREVLREMAKHSQRPIIFPLSNPTKNSECDAQTAVECTEGRCIFASGSPFPDVEYKSHRITPSQGNNMYIFPGLGYGAWLCGAKKVSDGMIDISSRALAECTTEEDLKAGRIYPPLSKIRDISAVIAARVMEAAIREGLAQFQPSQGSLLEYVKKTMYYPQYLPLNLEEAKEHARL